MQLNSNPKKNKSAVSPRAAKQDNLPPCEGFVEIPKFGAHPVMQTHVHVDVQKHIPDEFLSTASNASQQTEITTESTEVIMENNNTVQNNNTAAQQTVNAAVNSTETQTVLQEDEVGFITCGGANKPHWGIMIAAGAVIGAATNYDKGLVTMATGAVVGGLASGVVSHYVDDYTIAAASAAAVVGGLATRFLAPIVSEHLPGADNSNSDMSELNFADLETAAVC